MQLQDTGAVTVAAVLKVNTALTHLDLSHNNIQNRGTLDLALSIPFNSVLQTLDLSGNRFEVRNLAMLMRNSTSIRRLVLRDIHIQPREQSAGMLHEAIQNNSALRVLDLRDNGFSSLMFQDRHQDNPGVVVLV